MLLLKSAVSVGDSSGMRSFMIAGLILYMSLALFGLIFFIMSMTCFSVMCFSVN